MSESSPVNQALIAYVIGIILLLAFSMLIGMMIKSESEKQLDESDRRLEIALAKMGEIKKRIDELEEESKSTFTSEVYA
jgi:hypothetical protein